MRCKGSVHIPLFLCKWNRMKTRRNESRRDEARRLRRQGVGPSEIAARLDVSRQTIWRYVRDVTPVTPAPAAPETGNGAAGTGGPSASPSPAREASQAGARAHGGLIDWPEELGGAVSRLRESGSATATAQLAKLAASEMRAADVCEGHVPAAAVAEFVGTVNELWVAWLRGPFARRLAQMLDARTDTVDDLVEEAIAAIGRELNERRESAIAAQGAKK